ncbi:MAG: DUF6644 family protein [Pseudomonadota bacterium]
MSLLSFAQWLDEQALSTALHESLYAYPLIETTHVLTLCLFVGTVLMVDLRLLGVAFRDVPVSVMTSRVLPYSVAGFVVMFITGLLLFYAIPVRTTQSIFFRVKVLMLIGAAINVWFFHRRVKRDRVSWDSAPRPPVSARISAAVSIVLWSGVIVTGRMIAYNWFDCDRQPQPEWLNWAVGCVVEAA